MTSPNDPNPSAIEVGSVWACVTPSGRGLPVRVVSSSALSIGFHVVGREAYPPTVNLPADLFRLRYVPLSEVEARQVELRQNERRGETPELAEGVKVRPILNPSPTPLVKPVKAYRAQLTGEQAREIYMLMQDLGNQQKEVARTYGVTPAVVRNISRGLDYAWATRDLWDQHPPKKRKPGGGGWLENKPKRSTNPEPEMQPPPDPIGALPHGEPHRTPQVHEEPAIIARTIAEQGTQHSPRSVSGLLLSMADALETLVDLAGQPLPKFMTLDRKSIQNLIDRARKVAEV